MLTLSVEGMTCGHCASAVTKAIRDVDPKARVAADPATGKVEIESGASRDQLAAALGKAGYPVIEQNARTIPGH